MVCSCECMFPKCLCLCVYSVQWVKMRRDTRETSVYPLPVSLEAWCNAALLQSILQTHTHIHTHRLNICSCQEDVNTGRLCKGKEELLEGWMRAEWMECEFPFSRCCKHLPASSRHFINPSPSLHPTPPLSPHALPPNKATCLMFLFSVPLLVSFKCQVRYF